MDASEVVDPGNCVQPRCSAGIDLQSLAPNMLLPCDALPPTAVHRGMRFDAPAFV